MRAGYVTEGMIVDVMRSEVDTKVGSAPSNVDVCTC